MKKSLFKRLFTNIVIVMVIVFSIFLFVGGFIIEKYYVDMKVDELKPEMQSIINQINSKGKSNIDLNRLPFIIKAYDVYKHEMDVFNNPFKQIENQHEKEEPYFEENIKKSIEPFMDDVFMGKEVNKITNLIAIEGTSVVLGIPIKKNEQIIGGLFLLKPVSDFASALSGFNMIFLIMSIVILITILILLYISIKPLITPLKNMTYIAKKWHRENIILG